MEAEFAIVEREATRSLLIKGFGSMLGEELWASKIIKEGMDSVSLGGVLNSGETWSTQDERLGITIDWIWPNLFSGRDKINGWVINSVLLRLRLGKGPKLSEATKRLVLTHLIEFSPTTAGSETRLL